MALHLYCIPHRHPTLQNQVHLDILSHTPTRPPKNPRPRTMPSTPLHTSTHLNLPIASSTMSSSSHPTSTSSTRGHADKPTSKPKQTSSLLDRLKTASSSDKWAEPGGGGGGSTGPSSSSSLSSHGPGKRAGGMSWPTATITPTSATTNTSPSRNPNPLNYSDRDRVQGGTQESLSWSPSPDR